MICYSKYRLMTARCLQSAGKNNARVVEWVALEVPLTPLPHHSGGVSEGLQRQRCRAHSPDGQPTPPGHIELHPSAGRDMALQGTLVQGDMDEIFS